jgi:REP element-mobilizing transposase RayT
LKPQKGSKRLRKGRVSIDNQHYLITTAVYKRKPVFKTLEAAKIVLNSLHWLEAKEKIILDAAIVMPDHLHFVAGLKQGSLAQLIHSLKSYTAHEMNKFLQRNGPFWQSQYHDHAIRKDEDLNEIVRYTLNNPVRAGLAEDFREYPHWYCRWDL